MLTSLDHMISAAPTVIVRDLCKRYGRTMAIDRISFEIAKGEVVGLLGPNGAGKSTTMRILSGLIPATSGFASVGGVDVASSPEQVASHLGYMPENNPLPEEMRVREYLLFRAALKGLRGKGRRSRVDEVMETCDLSRKARNKLIKTLSKGFRQRVGIADALLQLPEVIILDEPTIGLDPHQIRGVRSLIQDLKGRMSVILSSHILPEIEQVCDRCIIINQGQVVAAGTPAQLRSELLPGQQFEVVIDGSLSQVEHDLRELDPSLLIHDSYRHETKGWRVIRFSTPGVEHSGSEMMEFLRLKRGRELQALRLLDASLEDVFVAATRRSWEDEIPLTVEDSGNRQD